MTSKSTSEQLKQPVHWRDYCGAILPSAGTTEEEEPTEHALPLHYIIHFQEMKTEVVFPNKWCNLLITKRKIIEQWREKPFRFLNCTGFKISDLHQASPNQFLCHNLWHIHLAGSHLLNHSIIQWLVVRRRVELRSHHFSFSDIDLAHSATCA